jgi:acyl carrier protein
MINYKILQIVNTVLSNNDLPLIEKLDEGQDLRNDLLMDSINLAELTVRIEDEFGIDVFEDGMISTIGELMAKINKV